MRAGSQLRRYAAPRRRLLPLAIRWAFGVCILSVTFGACWDARPAPTRSVGASQPPSTPRPSAASATPPICSATPTSLTPEAFRLPPDAHHVTPTPKLRTLADIPLPGPANRFDYQSVDSAARRLYISYMDAGRLVVFDLDSARLTREVANLPRMTGVLAVPAHGHVYASAAGAHAVAIIDDRTPTEVARVDGIRFPDGLAYAPEADKVFVSDESGESDVVIDARTLRKRGTIALGGEAGNTHYDSVSHCILVAVQTRGQLVAIDPVQERVVARYDITGVEGPHGFTLDEARRLAFVTGEGNAVLAVIDLRTTRVVQRLRVGDDPDVLAWDPAWRRLYVASESGVLSSFWAVGDTLVPLGDLRAPFAHTVSVDPRTHHVYLPLQNVGGRPVLRMLAPSP